MVGATPAVTIASMLKVGFLTGLPCFQNCWPHSSRSPPLIEVWISAWKASAALRTLRVVMTVHSTPGSVQGAFETGQCHRSI